MKLPARGEAMGSGYQLLAPIGWTAPTRPPNLPSATGRTLSAATRRRPRRPRPLRRACRRRLAPAGTASWTQTANSSRSSCTSAAPTAARSAYSLLRYLGHAQHGWRQRIAPARREAAADRITYRVPDLKDPAVRACYSGRRTAVIASAFTALAHLAGSRDGAGTKGIWILRRGISGSTIGGGEADQLPARRPGPGGQRRGRRGPRARGHGLSHRGGRARRDDRLILIGEDDRRLDAVDEVIVLTGFRSDLSS